MDRRFKTLPVLVLPFIISIAFGAKNDSLITKYDTVDVYSAKSTKPKSVVFESFPDSTYPTFIEKDSNDADQKRDTLALPGISAKPSKQDSMGKSFAKYWTRVEKEEGIDKLKDQMRSRDIEHSWVPHWYLFDSTVIFMLPCWFITRSKNK